jgi:3-oxoacyl-[acyl-carrier protein] reductase
MAQTKPLERVVVVTGASSGIGAAVCRRVAGPETALLIHALDAHDDGLEAVAAQLRAAGSPVETVLGDLCREGVAGGLIERAVEHFGTVDQIVSNAGFADRRLLGDVDRETLNRSLQAMTGAFFEMVTAALPSLQASPWGRVVAISSFVAHVFAEGGLFPTTAAAKAGIEALAKSLASQLAPSGTTVNCVAPGYTRKDATGHSALSEDAWKIAAEKTPMKRIADPDDHAALAAFLMSREARHITGQVIHVDGGLTLP